MSDSSTVPISGYVRIHKEKKKQHSKKNKRRHYLGNHVEHDLLSTVDATHAVGTLRVVAQRHVLAQREHRGSIEHVRDVGTSRVYLVVEDEPPLLGDTTLLEFHRAAGGVD